MIPDTTDAVLGLIAATALAALAVEPVSRLAWKVGAIDRPNERSLHDVPTARLGGLAILFATLVAGLIWLPWDAETRAILGGAIAITTVGALDDLFDLRPGLKLAGQIGAVAIPVGAGVTVSDFTLPFIGRVEPASTELVSLPLLDGIDLGELLTTFGIVVIINAVNFADGVDGLAAGVCAISAASLAVIALSLDRYSAGVLAAITAGAALGFLRHGFPPASCFMGDSGSNLLGFLLGMVAVQGALKTNAVVALFFPLIVLAVPILDTTFVVAKRLKQRRPIHLADRSHFHHRMAAIGFSRRRTLAYLYGWTLAMAGLALALRFVPYSDDRGNFDFGWTLVIIAFGLFALAASIYLVYVLEILKLRRIRFFELIRRGGPAPADETLNQGVEAELETGSFPAVDPDTGEFEVPRGTG